MYRSVKNALSALGIIAGIISVPFSASATIWNIDEILIGSSGFGASGFHDASSGSPMSGNALSTIGPGSSGVSGSYNDVTGAFSTALPITSGGGGPNFTLVGTLLFSGGLLSAPSTLFADFDGTITDPDWSGVNLGATTLGFRPGYVCCGSSGNDPNSFILESTPDQAIMTLWGADGFTAAAHHGTGGYTAATLLGMDLRLRLTERPVPEPGTLAIFAFGLVGLGFIQRRNRNRADVS